MAPDQHLYEVFVLQNAMSSPRKGTVHPNDPGPLEHREPSPPAPPPTNGGQTNTFLVPSPETVLARRKKNRLSQKAVIAEALVEALAASDQPFVSIFNFGPGAESPSRATLEAVGDAFRKKGYVFEIQSLRYFGGTISRLGAMVSLPINNQPSRDHQ